MAKGRSGDKGSAAVLSLTKAKTDNHYCFENAFHGDTFAAMAASGTSFVVSAECLDSATSTQLKVRKQSYDKQAQIKTTIVQVSSSSLWYKVPPVMHEPEALEVD
jgi:adenosylmethionine-8-amino-7-oxononanoate aminotransferase